MTQHIIPSSEQTSPLIDHRSIPASVERPSSDSPRGDRSEVGTETNNGSPPAYDESPAKTQPPEDNIRLRPSFEIGVILSDILSIAAPLALLGFSIAVLQLDNKDVHEPELKAWQNSITVIATLFPILFASIAGRMVYEAARWKLEKGTSMGSLEQLMGSRTVGATIITQFQLRKFNVLSICLLLFWAFSPFGSQSILRMLGTYNVPRLERSRIAYYDTFGQSNYATMVINSRSSDTYAGVVNSHLTSLFNALLLTPDKTKTDFMDLWGNVKIPMMDFENGAGHDGWKDVLWSPEPELYSSLLGLPVTNVSAGNTTFSVESSYMDLQCSNITRMVNPTTNDSISTKWSSSAKFSSNGTWYGLTPADRDDSDQTARWSISLNRFVDEYWSEKARPDDWTDEDAKNRPWTGSPIMFQNETGIEAKSARLLFQSTLMTASDMPRPIGITAYCSVVQRYIESRILCSRSDIAAQQNCSVIAQRPSTSKNPPEAITFLSFPMTWYWVSTNLPVAAGKLMSAVDLTVQYLDDPWLKNSDKDDTDSMFTNVDEQKFSRRLSQILNTYVLLSQVYMAATDGSVDANPAFNANITIPVEISRLAEVYTVSRPWMSLCIVSCLIFLSSGVMGTVFAHLCNGPEVLGYASTVIRDSKFIDLPPKIGRSSGMEIAQAIGRRRVRYGYTHLTSDEQSLVGVGLENQTRRIMDGPKQ